MDLSTHARRALGLSLLAVGALSARADFLLNQINPGGELSASPFLSPGLNWTATQVFTDIPSYSCMVIEDFSVVSGVSLTKAHLAFEFPSAGSSDLSAADGWKFSVWSSLTGARASGDSLNQNTAATALVSQANATLTPLVGSNQFLVTLDLSGYGLTLAPGNYSFGISVEGAFTFGQIFALASAVDGGGNGYFINPGEGFGAGPSVATPNNYAYALEASAIPEPGTFAGLTAGASLAVAFCLRNRRTGRRA